MRTRMLALTSVASLLLIAAACGDDSDDDSAMVDNVSSGSGQGESDEDGEGSAQTEAGEPIDATAGDDVIATTEGNYEATPNDSTVVPFTIDVTQLKRNGDLVELNMVLTNDHESVEFAPYSAFTSATRPTWDLAEVRLIDQEAQRAYLPIIDSEDVCLCTDQLDNSIPPGESVQLSATFGGLSSDVSAVDVHIPQTTPVDALSISG